MTETKTLETMEKEFAAMEAQYNTMTARLKELEAGEPEKEKDEAYILDTSLMYMAGDLNYLWGDIKKARGYRYQNIELSPQETEVLKKDGKITITLYTAARIETMKASIEKMLYDQQLKRLYTANSIDGFIEDIEREMEYAKTHTINLQEETTETVSALADEDIIF